MVTNVGKAPAAQQIASTGLAGSNRVSRDLSWLSREGTACALEPLASVAANVPWETFAGRAPPVHLTMGHPSSKGGQRVCWCWPGTALAYRVPAPHTLA